MMQAADGAMLIALDGPEKGKHWLLAKERYVIGRSPEADIVLSDRRISRLHAEVIRRAGRYFVHDLGSKNGTYVNGQLLDGVRALEDEDEIHLALATRLRFVGAGNTVPLVAGAPPSVGLQLDEPSRRVWVNGQELQPPLSQAQFRLLQLLFHRRGEVCSREEVVAAVWPGENEEGVSEQAIDALVRRLRERLAELDPGHCYVVTVRGHGFRLENRC